MDLAESDINRWYSLKDEARMFQKNTPARIMREPFKVSQRFLVHWLPFWNIMGCRTKTRCAVGITAESAKLLVSPLLIGKQRCNAHSCALANAGKTLFAQFTKAQGASLPIDKWRMTSTKINCTIEPLPIYVRSKTKAAAGSLCGIGNKDSNSVFMYEMALDGEPAKFVESLRASPCNKDLSTETTFSHLAGQYLYTYNISKQ